MVESARLESVLPRKRYGGSNPPLSVKQSYFLERWQSGRSRTLGERKTARSQGSNPCLSANATNSNHWFVYGFQGSYFSGFASIDIINLSMEGLKNDPFDRLRVILRD